MKGKSWRKKVNFYYKSQLKIMFNLYIKKVYDKKYFYRYFFYYNYIFDALVSICVADVKINLIEYLFNQILLNIYLNM